MELKISNHTKEMKKDKKETPANSRRKFINKGFFMSAGIATGLQPILEKKKEKIKMLTPDGKVVEVDPSVITRQNKGTKNKEILEWMDNPGLKKENNNPSEKTA